MVVLGGEVFTREWWTLHCGSHFSITDCFLLQSIHDRVDIHRQSFYRRRISGCLRVHSRGEIMNQSAGVFLAKSLKHLRSSLGWLFSIFWNSAGVSDSHQGFRSGNQQWDGQSRCPHYTFCCTGNILQFSHLKSSHRKNSAIIFVCAGLHPSGDAGVICVLGSVRVLLLLPPSCHRLMCTANWDDWPGTAGVQPPRVGPGDGGACLLSRLRKNPSV